MEDADKAMLEEVIVQTLFDSDESIEDIHGLADQLLEAILSYTEGFEV